MTDDAFARDLDLLDYKIRMSLYGIGRFKTLKRPSWLHPIKRVVWVHHYGPEVPEVKVMISARPSFGVIKGITG